MGDRSRVDPTQGVSNAAETDIPQWLSLLVLFSVSISLFLALVLNSNPYLTSKSGYADGGDMYSHQVEALYLKELLRNGTTDLWFDEITLGYPFFVAYHPFPCLFTSSLMFLTESFISPLLLFRWLFVLLLSSMPWSWYIGLRKLKMTRLEATIAALGVHSIHSWRKFGLELDAFQEYGIFTQAYGMAVFPLAAGFLYQYVIFNSGSRNGTILLLALNFTSHAFFGIYLGIVTVVTLLADLFTNASPLKTKILSPSIGRALYAHFFCIALLSWWIVPLMKNFSYIGGLPWKNDSENGYKFEFVLRNLLSGDMFDHGRKLPFITLGALTGLSCTFFTQLKNDKDDHYKERQILFVWLKALFCVTFYLLLGRTFSGPLYDVIPFHKEIEVLRYLNGIHFCGLILMGVSFSRILRFVCTTLGKISKTFLKSSHVLITIMLVLPPIYLSSQLDGINSRLTLTELGFPEGLDRLKAYPNNGRLLASKSLGSGSPWNLAILPHLTKKPGILTYSRGYHDTLSLYYLEHVQPSQETSPSFADLMRLYNIRFVATCGIQVSLHFLEACQLRHLVSIGDVDVFVRTPQEDYGYFEFAHVPGAIVGDLKGMREAVIASTQLLSYRALFVINPSSELLLQSLFKIAVSHRQENASIVHRLLSPDEFQSTWFVNKRSVRKNVFFEDVEFGRDPDQVLSRVLEEETGRNFYTAFVEVAEGAWNENFYQTEQLILKATYHPFWTCSFRTAADKNDQTRDRERDWHVIPVHHVTPNLMSMVLPPGRHHVTCKYKNPLYQKISFGLFIVVVLVLVVTELRKCLRCR